MQSISDITQKANNIKLLILDVDGVLTSGNIFYGSQGMEIRDFHIHDGLGIKLLQNSGIHVAIISGKKSDAVLQRIKELHLSHFYLGQEDKLPAFNDVKQKLQLTDDQIAYMGDDLPDLPLLRRSKLAITVPGAPDIIKEHADLITTQKAGNGAVREACEFIMKAQNKYQSMIESYLLK